MSQLKRYKGELDRKQLITARNKIVSNAEALYEEANILFEHGKYARTYFLLCIANEELGKSVIVTSGVIDLLGDNIDWKKFWRRIRNHKDKTGVIEHMENIFVSSDENFSSPEEIQKIIPTMEEIKMMSLYSDMIQDEFYEPCEIVSKSMAEEYLKLTKNRIDFVTSIGVTDATLRSIDEEKVKEHIMRLQKLLEEK